jgi:NDP-sugar pyrophosphorylase family protein
MYKPLIFLGSNSNIGLFVDTAEEMGMTVHGILDDNYYGNTDAMDGIPYIGSEETFNFQIEKDLYVFFVAPSVIPINTLDRQKRLKMISLVEKYDLPLATLKSTNTFISKSAVIHPGAFIGYTACVGANAVMMPHSQLHGSSALPHHCVLGKNSVIERDAHVMGYTMIGENVHIGFGAALIKSDGPKVGDNAVIQPRIMVLRDVDENEIVSLAGDNKRRIYGDIVRS